MSSFSQIQGHFNWPESTQACRIFHGRGGRYPEFRFINIDWFSPVVLIILYSEVERKWLDSLTEVIKAQLGERCLSIQVQYRFQHMAPYELLWGEDIPEPVADEAGLKYQLRLGKNQNYGLFFDMEQGRRWVQTHSEQANVLNLFAYTCGFSVAAIAGNARQVVNLDMSKPSLSVGRENHRLNQHDLSKVKFMAHDLFKSWGKLKKSGPYDLVIADPPSLQKGSINVIRDYPKIIRRLPELLVPGGRAMLCLNSPDLDFAFLKSAVAEHCPELVLEDKIEPSSVFINQQPDKGLKILIYRLAS
ncbi:class I SAM-dependent methyltransferase [Motilimonas cestriensis]|uniref:class I SAM-dependent methyltransferase n=1 Tax=Motilimonas cestriensis TaxID=2742685 RepID=UPI003DA1CCF4